MVGVTTNPTIFAKALADADDYAEQVNDLAAARRRGRRGGPHDHHVRRALGLRRDAAGVRRVERRGRPGLHRGGPAAGRTRPTRPSPRPRQLWWLVDRPNLFIKIPATEAGLPAITATLAEGISVNVTLIFSLDRYDAVMDAFLAGLEQAKANGHDLSTIGSVASFFVSRVDTEVDKRLDKIGTDGGAGAARQGRHRQRPAGLPALREGVRHRPLAGPGRRRRAPAAAAVGVDVDQEPGLPRRHLRRGADRARRGQHHAGGDHPRVRRPRRDRGRTRSPARTPAAQKVLDDLAALGIDYDDVIATLEREGVEKFEASWMCSSNTLNE